VLDRVLYMPPTADTAERRAALETLRA